MAQKGRILIADDEKDICELISITLESYGFETLVAFDPDDALNKVISQKPDLVISDVRMPRGGGLKLLDEIRLRDPHFPAFILVTGYSDYSIEEIKRRGAQAVLDKPVKLKDLVGTVEKVLAEQPRPSVTNH